MKKSISLILVLLFGGLSFLSGLYAQKNEPNMPNTMIHHVVLKWKEGTSEADQQKAIDGLKEILATSEGVKNVWMKTVKIQPREFSRTFVIEFENQAALEAYANHPKKKEWNDFYYSIRQESQNCVTTN